MIGREELAHAKETHKAEMNTAAELAGDWRAAARWLAEQGIDPQAHQDLIERVALERNVGEPLPLGAVCAALSYGFALGWTAQREVA